ASQAVRGASLMKQIELLEAQDSPPPPREVRGGCTPHPSQPDDDRVVAHTVIMANRVNASMHTDGRSVSWDCRSCERRNGRRDRGARHRTGTLVVQPGRERP